MKNTYNENMLFKENYNHGKEKIICYLLSRLFELRYNNGKNDVDFFQGLINDGLLTVEEICQDDGEEAYRPCSVDIPPVYANLIYKVGKKAASDTSVRPALYDYLMKQYLRKESYVNKQITSKGDKEIKKNVKRLESGSLADEQALFYSYIGLDSNGIDADELCCLGYRQGWMNRMFFKDERDCKKMLSVYLDCDVEEHMGMIEKYCYRRINEIFNYICSLCSANPDRFELEEKVSVIIGTACGFIWKEDSNQLDVDFYKLEQEGIVEKNVDMKSANALVNYLYPTKKVRAPLFADINLHVLHSDFAEPFRFEVVRNTYLKKGLFRVSVTTAILDCLIEKIAACYYKGESVTIDQIVRRFPFDKNDCKVALEKVNGAVVYATLANYHADVVQMAIENFNYQDLAAATKFSNSKSNTSSTSGAGYLLEEAKKQIEKLSVEKDEAFRRVDMLKKDNSKLKEENHRLVNKIAKTSNQHEAIESLKDENAILKDEVEELQKRIRAMEMANNSSNSTEFSPILAEPVPVELDKELPDELFKDMRFIIVGGRYEVNRRLVEFMPKARIVYDESLDVLDVNNYDGVLFFSEFVSHKLFNRYADQCRLKGAPFAYMRGSSIKRLKKEIYGLAQQLNLDAVKCAG